MCMNTNKTSRMLKDVLGNNKKGDDLVGRFAEVAGVSDKQVYKWWDGSQRMSPDLLTPLYMLTKNPRVFTDFFPENCFFIDLVDYMGVPNCGTIRAAAEAVRECGEAFACHLKAWDDGNLTEQEAALTDKEFDEAISALLLCKLFNKVMLKRERV